MADRLLNTAWQAVATGPGNATFEAQNPGVRWFVASATPNTTGLSAKEGENKSLALTAGQNLYLRGAGVAVVLADIPVGV
jgi:hypothetical protein